MQIRLIADLHLYDSYSYAWRQELDMNIDRFAAMQIDCWNAVCDDDTIVILVGDIGKPCPATRACLKRLKGIKVLVTGNHDTAWGSDIYDANLFSGTHEFIERNGMYIRHIPDTQAFKQSGATYFVHGHHHRYDLPGMQRELQLYARDVYRLNCCTDLIGYTPRTLQELILQKELLLDRYREKGLLGGI